MFLDTSDLFKLYHAETGTEAIESAVGNADEILLSEITVLEFRSALFRRVRENMLAENDAHHAVRLFDNDTACYSWIPLDGAIVQRAAALLENMENPDSAHSTASNWLRLFR